MVAPHSPPNAEEFIRKLPDDAKLFIRTTPLRRKDEGERIFDLGNLSDIRMKIARACDWGETPPDHPVGSTDHRKASLVCFFSRSLGRANFFNSTHLHSWGLFSTDWSISETKIHFPNLRDTLLTRNRFNYSERSIMKSGKRRTWTTDDDANLEVTGAEEKLALAKSRRLLSEARERRAKRRLV